MLDFDKQYGAGGVVSNDTPLQDYQNMSDQN